MQLARWSWEGWDHYLFVFGFLLFTIMCYFIANLTLKTVPIANFLHHFYIFGKRLTYVTAERV